MFPLAPMPPGFGHAEAPDREPESDVVRVEGISWSSTAVALAAFSKMRI
jgi:hypothetical protein